MGSKTFAGKQSRIIASRVESDDSAAVYASRAVYYGIVGWEVNTEVLVPVLRSLVGQGMASASGQVDLLEKFFLQAT